MAVDLEYFGVPPADYRELENRTRLIASAAQTTFTAPYSVGYVDVYFNGAKLDAFTEFTATDGATIVLSAAAQAGDVVEIISRAQVQLANVYTTQQVNALYVPYFGVATGTGNAQAVVTSPTFTSYTDGMQVRVRAAAFNTVTTPTIACNGLAAKTIVNNNGDQPLNGNGDWVAGTELLLQYNQTLDKFVLVNFSAQTYIGGRKTVYTANGTFVVPAGIFYLWVSGCAAGGTGGGSIPTANGNVSTGGSGGGAGQWVLNSVFAVTPGQSIPITIGAATAGSIPASGSPGYNLAGPSGGNTIVGSLLTLNGGTGGLSGTGGVGNTSYGGNQGGAGYPGGQYAQDVCTPNAGSGPGAGGAGGMGGVGPFGFPGTAGRGSSGGAASAGPGYGYGAGGSGSGGVYTTATLTAGLPGATGLPGYILLEF